MKTNFQKTAKFCASLELAELMTVKRLVDELVEVKSKRVVLNTLSRLDQETIATLEGAGIGGLNQYGI